MAEAPGLSDPVFLLNKELPQATDKYYSVAEICSAAEKNSGLDSIVGAQRIGGLWRIYAKSTEARVSLLTGGITLRGVQVQPKERNPFVTKDNAGEERDAVRVVIGGISTIMTSAKQ